MNLEIILLLIAQSLALGAIWIRLGLIDKRVRGISNALAKLAQAYILQEK